MESWEYRIEPYRAEGAGTWSPADETVADTWFLFGKKGDDERVFGVFSSRVGAEAANEYLIDWADTQGRGAKSYGQLLGEAARQPAKDNEKGIDR